MNKIRDVDDSDNESVVGDYIGFNPNPEGYRYERISMPKSMKLKLANLMSDIFYDKNLTTERIKRVADFWGIRMGKTYRGNIKHYRDELLLKLRYVYFEGECMY